MKKRILSSILLSLLVVSCGATGLKSDFDDKNNSDNTNSSDNSDIQFSFSPGSPVCSCNPTEPFIGLKSLTTGTCDCSNNTPPNDVSDDVDGSLGDNKEHPEDNPTDGSSNNSSTGGSNTDSDGGYTIDSGNYPEDSGNNSNTDSGTTTVTDSGTPNTNCNSFEMDCNYCYVFSYCQEYGYEEQIACSKELDTVPNHCTREESWDYTVNNTRWHVYLCKK